MLWKWYFQGKNRRKSLPELGNRRKSHQGKQVRPYLQNQKPNQNPALHSNLLIRKWISFNDEETEGNCRGSQINEHSSHTVEFWTEEEVVVVVRIAIKGKMGGVESWFNRQLWYKLHLQDELLRWLLLNNYGSFCFNSLFYVQRIKLYNFKQQSKG